MVLLLACCVSLGQGQDASWDLRNYHLYNPYSLLDGRLKLDLFPVGIQSYLNPLLDLPYYLLGVQLVPSMPRVVAFLAGIPFGLLILVVLRIARLALPPVNHDAAWLAPIATALGVSGAMTWSEIGTTYGDIPVAVIVLLGLRFPLSLVPGREKMRLRTWSYAMAGAGFLIGCATGLKLTACIYAPGALIGLALTSGSLRRGCCSGVVFCVSWVAGFSLTYGWWGLVLYQRFGNPVFPLLNQIFASTWVPAQDIIDHRFMPRSVLQVLFYPFFWLRGREFVVSETSIRDPRFALAYVAIVGVTCAALIRRRTARWAQLPAVPPVVTALIIFIAISYIVWEAMFSILRYAIGLEVLTGILIVVAVRNVAAGWPAPRPSAERAFCAVLLAVVIAISSRPSWGRLRHYGTTTFDIQAPVIPNSATVVLADKPIGFIVPFLPGHRVTFVGISEIPGPGRLQDKVRQRLHTGTPVLVLVDKPLATYGTLLGSFGLFVDQTACQPIGNPFDQALALCAIR